MKLLTVLQCTAIVSASLVSDLQSVFDFQQFQFPLKLHESSDNKPTQDNLVPILNANAVEDIIPDRYIMVYKEEATEQQIDEHFQWIQGVLESLNSGASKISPILSHRLKANVLDSFNINDNIKGYFGYLNEDLVQLIQKSDLIKYIEKETKVTINEFDVQKDATWGLARLSQRETFDSSTYKYDNEGGEGVTAYVIDTGIKVGHDEFEGRATWGKSVAFPNLEVDGNGHGTHCAGIIGSKTYGVAKKVDLVAVSVMNLLGSGLTSDIIKGIEFVVNDHKAKVASKSRGFKGSVINMSLGGPKQDTLDLAINAATTAGIHVAVAAGNDNADACEYSPAKAIGPISVGASNVQDSKASFSNWGACVDIFAPGEDIVSTYIFGDTTSMSGTSMASPHIAGLLAYYLSLQPDIGSEYSTGLLDPAILKEKIIKFGTKGVIKDIEDAATPNILAFNGAGQNLTSFWDL